MASEKEKKEKLIRFLNRKAFDPILKSSDSGYKSESEKKKLQDVKESTVSEKRRFSEYESASEVKKEYLNDLNSTSAKKINKELSQLDLPRLPDLKEEFLKLCEKLEVE
jgi:hypothetical protein